MRKTFFSTLAWGTLLLASSSLLSRMLGLLREVIFSKTFGVGELGGIHSLDAYFAAFRIPDLLYTFLITGALSTAFIPLYVRAKQGSQEEANHFANGLLALFFWVFFGLSFFLWCFAPALIRLYVPGFTPELSELTTQVTRILLLSPLFMGVSSLFQGIENAHKRFFGIALAPIFYNLSILGAAWFFGEKYGVYALAWGVVLGAILHFLVQIPGLLKTPFRLKWHHQWKSQLFKDFFLLSLPRLFGVSVAQFSLLIDTFLASLLTTGSLSVYNYALNFQSLPYGVVAVSFSMAIFPDLSEESQDSKNQRFVEILRKATSFLLFWILPLTLGIFFLREEIVRFFLERGAFSESASAKTTFTLGIFIWASLGQSLVPLFARAFYALQDSKRPVLAALFSVVFGSSCSLILTQVFHWDVWALALSAGLSASLNALLLMFLLARFLKIQVWSFFEAKRILQLFFLNALLLLLLLGLDALDLSLSVDLFGSTFLGAAVYLLAAYFTKAIPSLRAPQTHSKA